MVTDAPRRIDSDKLQDDKVRHPGRTSFNTCVGGICCTAVRVDIVSGGLENGESRFGRWRRVGLGRLFDPQSGARGVQHLHPS